MTPRPSIIGTITALKLFSHWKNRALVFGGLTALFVLLAFFPQRYHATATLTPTDPQSLGLSGTLGQLGAINSVFGNQAAVEIALRVANSQQVRDIVIKQLDLPKRMDQPDVTKIHRWLERKMTVRSLRGGIVLIEIEGTDGPLNRDLVDAYAKATQTRLAEISRNQTAYKRQVLSQLVDEASRELAEAQRIYDDFRLRNRAPSPLATVQNVSERIPMLEAAIKAKQVDIAAASQVYAPDNMAVRQLNAELKALQQQLAQVRMTDNGADLSVGRAVTSSSQLFKLERNLAIARALYDSYLKYLQGTAVEDLTSTANIRMLEPAAIDTERQIWVPAMSLAVAVFLLWMAIEFYRLRPPVGVNLTRREVQVAE